jgi:hypothetical protein
MRHRRHAAAFRWGGTVLTVLIAGLYLASVRWIIGHRVYNAAGTAHAYLSNISAGKLVVRIPPTNSQLDGFGFDRHSIGFGWWFEAQHAPLARAWTISIPLWVPLVLLGSPTALSWKRARRRVYGPGRCARCGYAMTL